MTSSQTVITRFAPSPTGFLHIGNARTALFNWLFARHHGGTFLLRIEDTDRKRYTEEAVDALLESLTWLGLDWDGEPISQFSRAGRHREIAKELLVAGKAYKCFCSPEELTEMREVARSEGRPVRYDGRWRDRDPSEAPAGVQPVIRLKAPQTGETVIADRVQGEVRVGNEQLDDLILLRSDGTPTYMLAVVVDDHDMGITHVIRGDDHLTNASRQTQIFNALNWTAPQFAHVPLIHGPDGAKLSKRHGALGAEEYRKMGYLPAAMCNYLSRLGWSHGDDEIFSTEEAISWFGLEAIGRSPARFDTDKLNNLNGHYIRQSEDAPLVEEVVWLMETVLGWKVTDKARGLLLASMDGLKQRAKTLVELAQNARYLVEDRPLTIDEKAEKLLSEDARGWLAQLGSDLSGLSAWDTEAVEAVVRDLAERQDVKLGKIAQPLRAALTGSTVSPGIFEVMVALGREETLSRIADQAG